jgi:hypothetical protein
LAGRDEFREKKGLFFFVVASHNKKREFLGKRIFFSKYINSKKVVILSLNFPVREKA